LPLVLTPATENIIRGISPVKRQNSNSLSYQITNYNRSDNYNGVQNSVLQNLNVKGWQFNNQFLLRTFKTPNSTGHFLRPVFDLSKQLNKMGGVRFGVRYAWNKIKPRMTRPTR
jgi:hypothetical protein